MNIQDRIKNARMAVLCVLAGILLAFLTGM